MPARHPRRAEDAADGQPAARPDAEDRQRRAVPGSRAEETARSTSCPILKCWPDDGGRYITLPLVFTKDPETGMRNIGTYRMQVFDGRIDRHALAAAQGRRAALPRRRAAGQAAAGRRGARAGSGAGVRRDGADARRARRADARRASSAASASSSSSASPSTSRCPPTRRSSSKATSSPASAAAKGRSAITPASTRIPTTIRSST